MRIVTPGTLTDDALLPAKADRALASVFIGGNARAPRAGLAWLNLASGDFRVTECAPAQLESELHRVAPAEIICAESAELPFSFDGARARVPDWHFEGRQRAPPAGAFQDRHAGRLRCRGHAGRRLRRRAAAYARALSRRRWHVQSLSAERPASTCCWTRSRAATWN